MKNNGQSGPLFATPYYSVQGLFGRFSLLASQLNGILGVIVVAIGRISLNPETG
jgi:hypothetical protein